MHQETIAIHAGEDRVKACQALTDPICQTATYTFENSAAVIDYVTKKKDHFEYGRYGSPNERTVEKKLAALDNAQEAVLFSSGMAALVGLLTAKLKAGDEIIFFDECYHRSREYCNTYLSRCGIKTTEVKTGDYSALEEAITPKTRLLISESPTNPHLSVVDLEQFVDIGKKHQVETLIDATLATPYNLQPVAAGVDYVLHSATKYLGGHNDLLAGVITGSKNKLEEVRYLRGVTGAVCAPQTIALLQRGLKTFPLRMKRHNENGQKLAEFLNSHERISKVLYPGLPNNFYYRTAKKSMTGFGGLITFFVKDADISQTAKVVDAVKIPRISVSLGGVESLIQQPRIMHYYLKSEAERIKCGITDNMIRYACGIENADDLIADLNQALNQSEDKFSIPASSLIAAVAGKNTLQRIF